MGVKKKYPAISVKLRPGKDDEIAEWWNSDPDRAHTLRKWIREKLRGESSLSTVPVMPNQPLREVEVDEQPIDLLDQWGDE